MSLVYQQPWLQQLRLSPERLSNPHRADRTPTRRARLSGRNWSNLVVSVTNLYWQYANSRDELRLRQRALEITQKFRADTAYEISLGALAGVELPRAEAEVASRRQDLAIAQATMRQNATLLKEAISHTEDPALEAAEIIPLDHIEVPETEEELPPLRQLLAGAMETAAGCSACQIQGSDRRDGPRRNHQSAAAEPVYDVARVRSRRGRNAPGLGRPGPSDLCGTVRHGAGRDLPARFPERVRHQFLSVSRWGTGRRRRITGSTS